MNTSRDIFESYNEWILTAHLHCVPLMLRLDPYEKTKGGETVLHWACQSKVKNKELIEKLLTVR